jgi:hypothetical protein
MPALASANALAAAKEYALERFSRLRLRLRDTVFTREALDDAKRWFKLLNVEKGVRPSERGLYENKRVFLTVENLAKHLQSEEVWGIIVGYRRRCANFIAFDCDENWPVRLRILREVLEDMGLSKAAFATVASLELCKSTELSEVC